MGKTILSPKQLNFLESIQREPTITGSYYLTGGTALAEFYLKHRLSEDIDLFTEKQEVNIAAVEAYLTKLKSKLEIKDIQRSQFLGLFSYLLVYKDGSKLKVDFSYYPFPRIAKGKKYKELQVDSIYDIAVNKLHTIFMQPRARDYIDLYFIMQEDNYDFDKMIIDAKTKFDWHIDRVNLGNQLLKSVDLQEVPRLLKLLDRKQMEIFFQQLAKSLSSEILSPDKNSLIFLPG